MAMVFLLVGLVNAIAVSAAVAAGWRAPVVVTIAEWAWCASWLLVAYRGAPR